MKDTIEQINIDIMVNKTSEIKNSELIREYCLLDARFRKVVHILKKWNNCISESPHKHLNNFSLYLMVIAFMQSRRMLPNLHALAGRQNNDSVILRQMVLPPGIGQFQPSKSGQQRAF